MAIVLPPLNTLRGFEAAARHLSFTKAAVELHVTQAAVSHQIKALEDWLGVKLFQRLNRSLRLTDAGQSYLPPVRRALDQIAAATDAVRQDLDGGPLRVSVLPSFGARWLLPRLPRFRQRYPDIDVLIQASNELADFQRGDIDVAIRFGFGRYPGLRTDRLLGDEILPVWSPALAFGKAPLSRLEDLRNHTLIHDDSPGSPAYPNWALWLAKAGVEGVDVDRGLIFSDSSMALQAALDGQGVALTRLSLAAADLAAQRLVEPFGLRIKTEAAYYVVAPEASAERPKIRQFRAWLFEEAAAHAAADAAAPPELRNATLP
jgi:LysR family glycine cleavage system transcriptional activator